MLFDEKPNHWGHFGLTWNSHCWWWHLALANTVVPCCWHKFVVPDPLLAFLLSMVHDLAVDTEFAVPWCIWTLAWSRFIAGIVSLIVVLTSVVIGPSSGSLLIAPRLLFLLRLESCDFWYSGVRFSRVQDGVDRGDPFSFLTWSSVKKTWYTSSTVSWDWSLWEIRHCTFSGAAAQKTCVLRIISLCLLSCNLVWSCRRHNFHWGSGTICPAWSRKLWDSCWVCVLA
jgi:hypothetical protein